MWYTGGGLTDELGASSITRYLHNMWLQEDKYLRGKTNYQWNNEGGIVVVMVGGWTVIGLHMCPLERAREQAMVNVLSLGYLPW